MKSGDLSSRATFQPPVQARDADGQLVQGWGEGFTAWVAVKYLRGGEVVMQARMQSHSPAILTLRASSQSRRVTSEWRATIDGRVFAIKEDPRPTADRAFVEMLAEAI